MVILWTGKKFFDFFEESLQENVIALSDLEEMVNSGAFPDVEMARDLSAEDFKYPQ